MWIAGGRYIRNNQCCFNVGPASQTVGQHYYNTRSASRAGWNSSLQDFDKNNANASTTSLPLKYKVCLKVLKIPLP